MVLPPICALLLLSPLMSPTLASAARSDQQAVTPSTSSDAASVVAFVQAGGALRDFNIQPAQERRHLAASSQQGTVARHSNHKLAEERATGSRGARGDCGGEGSGVSRRSFAARLLESAAAAGGGLLFTAGAIPPSACGAAGPIAERKTISVQDVKKGIEADFVTRQYYVTGDLTSSLYQPDCLFTDPTTRVASVDRYTAAVKLLFDPDNAQVDLLSLEVQDDTHLFAKWRLQGFLKFPWHPYVAPYTGTTLYTLNSDGLISSHEETWSISALEAARATITPTAGPPKTAESS